MFRHVSAAALVFAAFALFALPAPLAAQSRMDPDINAKIRQEENTQSQIMKSAVAIAATLYQLAMRDEMLPRFAPADMPAPVAR
jgi:hypothetical protein